MEPRTTYERYWDDPFKVALKFYGEAVEDFESLREDYERAMRHYVGKSKHIDSRRASKDLRTSWYFHELNPGIQTLVDVFMAMFRGRDPILKADPRSPLGAPPELIRQYEDSGNRIELLNNRFIRGDKTDFMPNLEEWFIAICLFKFSAMRISIQHQYKKVPYFRNNGNGRREFLFERVLNMAYPTYEFRRPDEFFPDMRNRYYQRYNFDVNRITVDQFMALAEFEGYSKRKVDNIIDRRPSTAGEIQNRLQFEGQSLEEDFNDDEIALIYGYIMVYNPDTGFDELREIHFVQGPDEKTGLLLEREYDYSCNKAPFIMSRQYILPGEFIGMSTADLGATMADIINEAVCSAVDGATKALMPPMVIPHRGIIGGINWGPGSTIKLNMDTMQGMGLTPQNAVNPLVIPPMDGPMVKLFSIAEARFLNLINTPDVTSGARYSEERKENTLGKERMRLSAANQSLARMMGRHADELAKGFNVGWNMARYEIIQLLNIGELAHNHVEPELSGLKIVDLLHEVHLELSHIRAYTSKEDEFSKMLNVAQTTAALFPDFAVQHPNGIDQLLRMIYEAGDIKGAKRVLDTDGGVKTTQMPINAQQIPNTSNRTTMATAGGFGGQR